MNSFLPIPNESKLVSVAEMQAIEKAADAAGHAYATMMELAGQAVANVVLDRAQSSSTLTSAPIVVLVGPGNNGGDGLVCARHLHLAGASVRVYLWKRRTEPEHDYEQHFAKLTALGVSTASADDDANFAQLRTWLGETTIVVDALLGTRDRKSVV